MKMGLGENNRPERMIASVQSAESTATISRGQPVVLNLSTAAQPTTAGDGFAVGYQDGLQVVLPSTAGSPSAGLFFYGVCVSPTINPNQLGEVVIHGICPYALVLTGSRSGTVATWASSASSSSIAYALSIDTVNNVFNTFTPSIIGASWTGSTVSATVGFGSVAGAAYQILMLDSIATQASSTSYTSITQTFTAIGYRAFVRCM
jgi:hypothetical protein